MLIYGYVREQFIIKYEDMNIPCNIIDIIIVFSFIAFQSHMSFEDALKLRVNDKIDHRDKAGRYFIATVIDKQGTNLKIHYNDIQTI